jgi:hypothetical protein
MQSQAPQHIAAVALAHTLAAQTSSVPWTSPLA